MAEGVGGVADLRWWEADLAGFLYCFERLPSQPEHVQASS